MRGIQVLDHDMIDKIAAGEVVERPLSIVKELTENAIDAGAAAITVEIENGGLSMVRVTDNGAGIPREQVRTAFQRHATSKIRDIDDLVHVMTLGFRGEALSSIAAVAQVEVITKTAHDLTGVRMELHGGREIGWRELGCAEGTTIITRNVFYNTPARLHFLKKPATEAGYISDIIGKLALGHPDIAFTYINNGAQVMRTNGNGDLKTAIFHVYGKEAAQKIMPLACTQEGGSAAGQEGGSAAGQEGGTAAGGEGFQLNGYVGKPEIARGNRSYGNFYINGRYVKSELLQSAVEEGYKTLLPVGKFPLFVLYLQLAPDTVDVNVHPNKLDIRFKDEKAVFQYCVEAVEGALKENNLVPEWYAGKTRVKHETLSVREDEPEPVVQSKLDDVLRGLYPGVKTNAKVTAETRPAIIEKTEQKETIYASGTERHGEALAYFRESARAKPPGYTHESHVCDDSAEECPARQPAAQPANYEAEKPSGQACDAEADRPFFHEYTIIGQVFQTYWIVEQGDSIYFIDQHAAHERALYHDLTQALTAQDIPAQQLLQPVVVHLSPSEKVTVTDNTELLHEFGFAIEEFGEQAFLVRAVPFIFKGPVPESLFLEIVDRLGKVNTAVSNLYDIKLHTIATVACKAAVKAHDILSEQEARALIDKILSLENPFTCPHGRPTIIRMTKYETEKKFKRV